MGYATQQTHRRGSDFLEGTRDLSAYIPVMDEFKRVLVQGGIAAIHLGVVRGRDMAVGIRPIAEQAGLRPVGLIYEDASHLETHGRTARGGTAQHQYLFLQKE